MIPGIVAQGSPVIGGTPAPTDPLFANVVFLTHGEGADGATSFVDYSSYGRTITTVGAAQADTDIPVGDSPSILLGSDANYLVGAYIGTEMDITATTPDFCMEAYIYCTDVSGSNLNQIFGRRRNSGQYMFALFGSNLLFQTFDGTTATNRLNVATSIVANTVYHVAAIRVGTTYYGFVDGVLVGSATSGAGTVSGNTTALYIGQSENDQPARYWRGNLNWLRITMGDGRYNVAGFTPPSLPLPKA